MLPAVRAWLDHPELRVAGQQALGLALHLHVQDHLAQVLGEVDALDRPEIDGLVAHLGLSRGQAVGAAERDHDLRAAAFQGAEAEIAGDPQRHQRHQPDEVERAVPTDLRLRQVGSAAALTVPALWHVPVGDRARSPALRGAVGIAGGGVPHQPRVEAHGGEHRQDHHRAEGEHAGVGKHRGESGPCGPAQS